MSCATPAGKMKRLIPVIAELEAARNFATARFASEANMPIEAFLRHFRVICESGAEVDSDVQFRVEPRADD